MHAQQLGSQSPDRLRDTSYAHERIHTYSMCALQTRRFLSVHIRIKLIYKISDVPVAYGMRDDEPIISSPFHHRRCRRRMC